MAPNRSSSRSRRRPAVAAVLLLSITAVASAPVQPAADRRPLADGKTRGEVADLAPGKFLVASRELRDTHFARTVILLLDYDEEGALGLIVNRRTPLRVASVFPGLGELDEDQHSVFEGGPVDRRSLLMLVRMDGSREGSVPVFANVHVSASVELLESLLREGRSDDFRVFSGYAGWAPGQLDREIELDTWHILDADPELIFDDEPDSTWERLVPIDPTQRTALPRPVDTLLAGLGPAGTRR